MKYRTGITALGFVLASSLLAMSLRASAWQPTETSAEAKIVVVGDLMLGRYVGASLRATGYSSAFTSVKSFISGADLAVGNLEGPLVPADTFVIPAPSINQPLLIGDAVAARSLAGAGFDILSLANNHSLDAGESGLNATSDAIKDAGMQPIGTRQNGRMEAAIRDIRGLKIALLAYTLITPNQPQAPGAVTDLSYLDPASKLDMGRMATEIATARGEADVVVVVMHWGTEYSALPDDSQKQVARVAAGAGADIVVGAHPHVAQGMELLGGASRPTLVAYSLGNALFDQNSRRESTQGLALEATVDRDGVRMARLVPLKVVSTDGHFSMSLDDAAGGQETLRRAALSTAASLTWQGIWSTSTGPGIELAYRRNPQPQWSQENLGMDNASQVSLSNGMLSVNGTASGEPVSWQTDQGWRVTAYAVGDADGDGNPEIVYTLWKPRLVWTRPPGGGMAVNQDGGEVLPHIYINGFRRGEMRPVWHGSPRPAPVLAVAVAPIGKEGKSLLASLDSSDPHTEKAPGTIHIWEWTGGFGYELAATPPGAYSEMWSDGKVLLFR